MLVTACASAAAAADEFRYLKRDGWERLDVLARTLRDQCITEDVLGQLIGSTFESARIEPVIRFRSEFEDEDRRFRHDEWREHVGDDLYLMVTMGCIAEVGDWGMVLGHIVYVWVEFFSYDPRYEVFRSWGSGWQLFDEAGILEAGWVAQDHLYVVLGIALDDYLEANLGSAQAVVDYRDDYPREALISEMTGPYGAKAKL